jgi:RNA polymerase sigma-70 factor (ECF subfamily)
LSEQTKHIHQHLVKKAKLFDRKAQGELYQLYNKAMFNTSLRIVSDSYLAEDIMQDSFIDGFRRIASLQDESSFGAWLKKIVINNSINQVNRTGLISEKLEQVDFEFVEQNADDFQVEVAEVKNAMKSLAKQYQIIFSLYLIEGYDHEEISEILNISSSTSRSQLSRAKQKVKGLIEKKRGVYEIN